MTRKKISGPPAEEDFYWYKAVFRETSRHPLGIVDGDTVILDIDFGCNKWAHKEYVRLYGINSPEVQGEERPAGLAAEEHLRDLVREFCHDGKCIIRTYLDERGKYGRLLAEIWLPGLKGNLNTHMVRDGHAEVKLY